MIHHGMHVFVKALSRCCCCQVSCAGRERQTAAVLLERYCRAALRFPAPDMGLVMRRNGAAGKLVKVEGAVLSHCCETQHVKNVASFTEPQRCRRSEDIAC